MTAADFTIADVLAWARTKPAGQEYCSTDIDNCAIAQFGRETGRMYLVGVGSLEPYVGYGKALTAIILSRTFGELVGELECVVEPSFCKRAWAKLTSKTIGEPLTPQPLSAWSRPDAYLTDIEDVARERVMS